MPKLSGGGARARKRLRRTYGVYQAADGVAKPLGIHVLKERSRKCGGKFFEPDSMRFFHSRLAKKAYPSKTGKCFYFVTSEAAGWDRATMQKRKYTVRKMCRCSVDTVGQFQQYKTLSSATNAAKRLAKKDKR